MSSTSRATVTRASVATGLIIAAVLLGAMYRIVSGTEHHAFSAGAVAPETSHVTAGKTYTLSVPGGVPALRARGVDVTTAQCEWSVGGSASQALVVAASGTSTKATNVVGTFVAPYTGDLHVDCLGWGPMFLDNADGSPGDTAGWLLLLTISTLTIGVVLGLSALRRAGLESDRAASEDDEVERLVYAVHVRSEDSEVSSADDGDVGG